MRRFRTTRILGRFVAVITIMALASHGLMPPAQAAQGDPGELSLEAALNLICTAGGLVDRNQNPTSKPGDTCPLCPIFTCPALTPAQNVTPLPQQIAASVQPIRHQAAGKLSRPTREVLPRAPPHLIV